MFCSIASRARTALSRCSTIVRCMLSTAVATSTSSGAPTTVTGTASPCAMRVVASTMRLSGRMTHRWRSHAITAVSATTAASATARMRDQPVALVVGPVRRSDGPGIDDTLQVAHPGPQIVEQLAADAVGEERRRSRRTLRAPDEHLRLGADVEPRRRRGVDRSERRHDLRDVTDRVVDLAFQSRCVRLPPLERPQEVRVPGDHEPALPGLLVEIGRLEPSDVRRGDDT